MRRLRWIIADYLSRAACWLRGHSWYVADCFYGVPGNRAAELKQRIWINCTMLNHEDAERLAIIDHDLSALAQLAGENWGHIY